MNRYLYAEANPATLIDPDGHRACMDTDGTCAPSGEADQVWEQNKQEVRAAEQRRVDAISAEGCQRTGICEPEWASLATPVGTDWSTFTIAGRRSLLSDASIETGDGWLAGDCAGTDGDAGGDVDTLATWVLAGAEGARGSREWVSSVARCLRTCTDAGARSEAGRLLRAAGDATAFGRSAIYKRLARKVPVIGFGVDVGLNLAEGRDLVEAVGRGLVTGVFGAAGVGAGGIVCAGGTALSGGTAAIACIAAVGAGAYAGGEFGDWVGDRIFGPDTTMVQGAIDRWHD